MLWLCEEKEIQSNVRPFPVIPGVPILFVKPLGIYTCILCGTCHGQDQIGNHLADSPHRCTKARTRQIMDSFASAGAGLVPSPVMKLPKPSKANEERLNLPELVPGLSLYFAPCGRRSPLPNIPGLKPCRGFACRLCSFFHHNKDTAKRHLRQMHRDQLHEGTASNGSTPPSGHEAFLDETAFGIKLSNANQSSFWVEVTYTPPVMESLSPGEVSAATRRAVAAAGPTPSLMPKPVPAEAMDPKRLPSYVDRMNLQNILAGLSMSKSLQTTSVLLVTKGIHVRKLITLLPLLGSQNDVPAAGRVEALLQYLQGGGQSIMDGALGLVYTAFNDAIVFLTQRWSTLAQSLRGRETSSAWLQQLKTPDGGQYGPLVANVIFTLVVVYLCGKEHPLYRTLSADTLLALKGLCLFVLRRLENGSLGYSGLANANNPDYSAPSDLLDPIALSADNDPEAGLQGLAMNVLATVVFSKAPLSANDLIRARAAAFLSAQGRLADCEMIDQQSGDNMDQCKASQTA